MGLFSAKRYSRRDALTAASEANKKGKTKKAIALYESVIENDGEDPMVLHKLGDCLAEARRRGEALDRFTASARLYETQGFVDKALAVCVTASRVAPKNGALWERISELHLTKNQPAQAIKVLMEARRHFRWNRDERIRLLRRVRAIDEWHFAATFALAHLSPRSEKIGLLGGLAERTSGPALRRVRGALFRSGPTPAALWRWVRAAVVGR